MATIPLQQVTRWGGDTMAITVVNKKAVNLMSLILAIPCSDRVVIAADGRTTDFETGKTLPATLKIFELTDNSAVLVAGNGLVDKLDRYMDDLVHAVRIKGHTNVVDIALDVKEIID